MLVVSRKPDEAIVFPGLGITVRIIRSNNRGARIGIDAPPEIRVLRSELLDGSEQQTFDVESFGKATGCVSGQELHELRNQLNVLNLGLQYYRHQMDRGLVDEANVTFLRVLQQLNAIQAGVSKPDADCAASADAMPVRLLLVEDDAEQRDLLAGILSMQGCHVATASCGREALEYLESHPWPDFVLLDMRMPNGDGASTIRKLRETFASENLRILATSGTSPESLGVKIGRQGVDQWFPKPLNTEGLMDYMRSDSEQAVKHASPLTGPR